MVSLDGVVCRQSRWRHSVTVPHTRWRICVTMTTLWQQQDGGYMLLWKRYGNNEMAAMRIMSLILHLQQYSHRLNLFYYFWQGFFLLERQTVSNVTYYFSSFYYSLHAMGWHFFLFNQHLHIHRDSFSVPCTSFGGHPPSSGSVHVYVFHIYWWVGGIKKLHLFVCCVCKRCFFKKMLHIIFVC